jgi:hypothetical protein
MSSGRQMTGGMRKFVQKACFAQENLPTMMCNRRGQSVSRDARGGPNPDRFRNNGKICIKLADSRGKRPGLAVPGGMDGGLLAPAEN